MARFEDAMQRFWLRDLHRVSGAQRSDLKTWICNGQYVLANPVPTSTLFSLQVVLPPGFLSVIAYESNRMVCAAIETALSIKRIEQLPRSTAWMAIQIYYAAFFAAHALLRMFGTICFQFEAEAATAVNRVAMAQGCSPPHGFEKGFYTCSYDPSVHIATFRKSTAASRGSHEILWEVFIHKLRNISADLLTHSSAYTPFAVKLTELEAILCERGHASGSWLSNMRNGVNYRHEFGAWFPYREATTSSAQCYKTIAKWLDDPLRIPSAGMSNPLDMHLAACALIVSICRTVAIDMSRKCPTGKSFHAMGCLALMNRISTQN